MTYLAGRVMRTHVRTVCFSAWFLMGTRLMQSYCLCVCVYILLPSPITFGLIAQFQQGGRASRGAAGPAGTLKSVGRVRLWVFTAAGAATAGVCMAQAGEQCRAAGNGAATVLLVDPHRAFCCSLFDTDTLTGEPPKPHLLLCFFLCKTG